MSEVTTPAPGPRRRLSVLRWTGLGTTLAVVLAGLTVALWPASESDKAREDGENVGQAVADLRTAESTDDVDNALDDLHSAVRDTRDHAGDAIYDQVDAQGDAIYHAVNGFLGATSTDDEWEADVYEAELETAVEDLNSQAEEFRTEGPEVQQAFWDGVQDGLSTE
jgi:hypothetical protein